MLKPRISFEVGVGSGVASIWIEAEHGFDEFLSAAVLEVPRELHVALDDALVDIIRIFGIPSKGQLSNHELEQHHTNRPKIHQLVVLLTQDDFGCHVVRSADDRIGPVQLVDDLGRTKGNKPKIASLVHNEVVWLQIADHNFLAHEVLEEEDQ